MLKHLQSRDDWSEKSVGAKGFTLIELLVVIIILGVLAAVAIFAVGSINDRAKTNACKNEQDTVRTAIESYNAQAGDYPAAGADLTQDVTTAPTFKAVLKSEPSYFAVGANGKVAVKSGVTLPGGCTLTP